MGQSWAGVEERRRIPTTKRKNNIMSGGRNFIESYCVKITDIPIHLINQIKDQKQQASQAREGEKKVEEWNLPRSYLFLIKMDYVPRKLQSKLMKTLTQMYRNFHRGWKGKRAKTAGCKGGAGKTRLFKSLWKFCRNKIYTEGKCERKEISAGIKSTSFPPPAFRLEYN